MKTTRTYYHIVFKRTIKRDNRIYKKGRIHIHTERLDVANRFFNEDIAAENYGHGCEDYFNPRKDFELLQITERNITTTKKLKLPKE